MRALLLCLLLFPAVVRAADDARPVLCRFLCFNATTAPDLIHVASADAEVRCEIPLSGISPETRCMAKNNIITFLNASDRKPAAAATVGPTLKAALLVFLPAAQAADAKTATLPWRVFVIDDSPENYPDGGAFVANFYAADIRFQIGEHKNMLHRGGNHGFTRPEKRDAFNMAPVIFEFQQDDQTWRTASESMVRFLPGVRYLIFAYLDPASGRPRITTVTDVKPVGPPPATPKPR